MKTKKKILMFSYSFPPIKGIGTLRNFNIASQFQKHFEVKILSTKNRFILPTENINVADFDIRYLQTFDYKTIKGKKHLNAGNASATPKISKKVIFIRKLINSFPFNLFFGEGGLIYIVHGLYWSIKYDKKGYSIIYSSYRPISDHYLAYLSKVFNKKRIWIADYRDIPYHGENQNLLFPKFQIYILNKIIKKADYVITISEGLKSFFEAHNDNVMLLRNGMSNLLQKSVDLKENNKFTITYTGTLYAGKRDPSILFNILNKLIIENKIDKKDLNLIYAGKEGSLWEKLAKKYNLTSTVTNHGMLSVHKSISLQFNSHINLLLSWASKEQKGILTGKFFEYINARKTILLIIRGVKDEEFEEIIYGVNIGFVAYENDKKALESFVIEKYKNWKRNGTIDIDINEVKLNDYTWDSQFDKFYSNIDID